MNKIKSIFVLLSLVFASGLLFYGFSSNDENNSDGIAFNEKYHIIPVRIPAHVTFAGEAVPLENFDTYESLDRELLVNTYWQSQTLLYLKRANKYFPIIEPILKEQGVPDDFKYLAVAESGLSNTVSPANAVGFWQFLDATAKDYNLEVNDEVDERYHLEKSTKAAAKFLKESYAKHGSWALAAASYNMGRKNISTQVDRQKSENYYDLVLGEETGRYLFRLIALKLVLESPNDYGFFVNDKDLYKTIDYKTVVVDSAVTNWADFANKNGINYKILKELNPWLRSDRMLNKLNKKYEVKIADTKSRTYTENPKFFPQN